MSFAWYSYYHKVPAELPAYEKKQEEVYGLVTPEDFTLPPHHALWTEESYNGFQVETRDTSNDTLVGSFKGLGEGEWCFKSHSMHTTCLRIGVNRTRLLAV